VLIDSAHKVGIAWLMFLVLSGADVGIQNKDHGLTELSVRSLEVTSLNDQIF